MLRQSLHLWKKPACPLTRDKLIDATQTSGNAGGTKPNWPLLYTAVQADKATVTFPTVLLTMFGP
jgi:hypothetical protein